MELILRKSLSFFGEIRPAEVSIANLNLSDHFFACAYDEIEENVPLLHA